MPIATEYFGDARGAIVVSIDHGASWHPRAGTVIAVGARYQENGDPSGAALVLISTDGGASFQEETLQAVGLSAVWGASSGEIYAAEGGRILVRR